MNESNAVLAREFAAYLQGVGRAKATVANTRSHIGTFDGFLASVGIGSYLDVGHEVVERYQEHLLASCDYTSATVTAKLCTLKAFYRYLVGSGRIEIDPTEGITLPRKTVSFPRTILSKRQAGRLMRAPDTRTDSGIRDRAILECLYSTGIRAQELCDLTVDSVDTTAGLLSVRQGKGRKDRMVPVGPTACRWIEAYRDKVRPHHVASTGEHSLFVGIRSGRGIDTNTLRRLVARHGRNAPTRKHVTPHVIRHSCATHTVASGADIRYVQELLGHELLETTQGYVRASINDLRRMHRLYHPREQDEY